MHDILGRWMYILGFVAVIVFVLGWFSQTKNKIPKLPAKLAAVKCIPKPENAKHAETNRMLLEYDNYAIYQICIPSFMMREKDKLKCGYAEDQMTLICDETAILQRDFVHSGINDIYAIDKVTTQTPNAKSMVTIHFSEQSIPIRKPRSEYYTTESYVKQGIHVPSKLRLRADPVCQSPLSGKPQGKSGVIRDSSSCFVDAAFGVLNISLEIEAMADSNDRLTHREQLEEINFWLEFVDHMVVAN